MTDEKPDEKQEVLEIIETLLKHYRSFKGNHFENLDSELSYWIEKIKKM